MKSRLSVVCMFTLFMFLIACGDGSIHGEDNLSPEELLAKAQQPLKQTKGFAYTVQGTKVFSDDVPFPYTHTDEFFWDVRANNEPFTMFYKGNSPNVFMREGYLLQKHCYVFTYGRWGQHKVDIVNRALMAPSPYDSIHQASSLLSMLKEWQLNLDKQYMFTIKHEDGMYILKVTNNFPSDFDPPDRYIFDKVDSTFDSWFKKEFKVLLNAENVVDQEYIDQHPNEDLTNINNWSLIKFRQSMWFDDQTFVLKKMFREVKVHEHVEDYEIKTEMNLKGRLKEKVVLPQKVIDQLE